MGGRGENYIKSDAARRQRLSGNWLATVEDAVRYALAPSPGGYSSGFGEIQSNPFILASCSPHSAGSSSALVRGNASKQSQTRTHMAFLIDSLQYYLMADVLDTKMTAFTAKLENSTSFEEVKLCHDLFLTEVQASIFLHNPQVQKCLTDLMDNCQQFCKAKSNQVDASAQTLAFSRQSALLLQLLASLRSHLAPPGLAQLLTRIDYNRFFSKHNRASQ